MIPLLGINLPTEHPIGISRVRKDNRDQNARAHEHEDLGSVRGGRFPKSNFGRHDVREHADPEPHEAQAEHR